MSAANSSISCSDIGGNRFTSSWHSIGPPLRLEILCFGNSHAAARHNRLRARGTPPAARSSERHVIIHLASVVSAERAVLVPLFQQHPFLLLQPQRFGCLEESIFVHIPVPTRKHP